jgi:hypothetical protein
MMFFKIIFIWKYIKIIFFYFLKNNFYINILNITLKYKKINFTQFLCNAEPNKKKNFIP